MQTSHQRPRPRRAGHLSDQPSGPPRAPAFTLIELLVVIIIIGIVVSIAFPVSRRMLSYSRGEAGVNSVSTAVNAARIYAHRLGNMPNMGEIGVFPYPQGADYSGTAALFTPGGEIRLVINGIEAQRAAAGPNFPDHFIEYRDPVNPVVRNAYTDIDTDYVQLPSSVGVAGVTRKGAGSGGIRIIPPPFAIRFNEFGQMANDQEYIYYDGDHDGVYDTSSAGRVPSDYDPDEDDPRLRSVPQTDGVYHLPADEIPTVSAVILFDASAFRNDGPGWGTAPTDHEARRDWFARSVDGEPRGTVIYFNPNSGAMLRGD